MDKKIAGLLGAVAALGTMSSGQAAVAPTPGDALRANSYADLLEPIPNAGALLQAIDAQQPAPTEAKVQLAQVVVVHHHHHHHHVLVPPHIVVRTHRHHHHHHHHHHHGVVVVH